MDAGAQETPPSGIIVARQTERPTFVGTSRLTKVMIDRSSGVRGASVSLVTMPPGGETEKHAKEETEIIFVIRGMLRLNTPKGSVTIEAGDGGAIPPRTLHSHQNAGREWNQFLVIITPDGPEQGFLNRTILEKVTVQK